MKILLSENHFGHASQRFVHTVQCFYCSHVPVKFEYIAHPGHAPVNEWQNSSQFAEGSRQFNSDNLRYSGRQFGYLFYGHIKRLGFEAAESLRQETLRRRRNLFSFKTK